MPIHLSTTNPELHLNILDDLVKLYTSQKEDFAKVIFPNKVSVKELYHRVVQWSGLAAATRADESGGVAWQSGVTPFKKDFFPYIYQIGVKYSEQARFRDLHNVYKRYGTEMGRAIYKGRQAYAADMGFNNVTTATGDYLGIDGVALSATTHPTRTTTWSNRATGAALSQTSFESTYIKLWDAREYMDDPYIPMGPWNLLYSPTLVATARKLLETERVIGSNNNDKNIIREFLRDPGPNPFFTNTTRFGFVPVNADDSAMFEGQGMPLNIREWFDGDIPAYKLLANQEMLFGWGSAYNTVWNEGL